MAKQAAPHPQIEFHGVHTSGNPANRPFSTAAKCTDFRVMPGYWLRLRGGRKARYYIGDICRRILPFRDPFFTGSALQILHSVAAGSPQWSYFNPGTSGGFNQFQPFLIGSIGTAYDSSFTVTNPAPACALNDRPLLYNGLGVRDGTNSRPPFDTYFGGALRYFGMDAYCPGGTKPTVAFAGGAGNNTVTAGVTVYVGLYNSATNHYSNGVLAGSIAAQTASGTITVSNLARLSAAYHTSGSGELFFVFYVTVDTGITTGVPYLVLNSTLDGPLTAAIGSGSQSLSVTSSYVAGYFLDLTKEMPITNFPPRPMRSVCYVNGRVYGALANWGSGTGADFSYVPALRDLSAVVWSQAQSDIQRLGTVGDPLQCWPLTNIQYTPSSDAPTVTFPAQDGVRVLVITPSSTFLLGETADGLHEWITVSRVFGIGRAESIAVTPYGICWVTQFGHIVMLPPNSTTLVYLSRDYQNLIQRSATVTAADYIFNASNLIDRYQIWLDDGRTVVHDFIIGGEGYDGTNFASITAAATVVDAAGKVHHMIASNAFMEHEAQYDTDLIPTVDETYTAPTVVTTAQINGEYRANWTAEGDAELRKELAWIDVLGDGAVSTQLAASPLSIEWYADFERLVSGNKKTMVRTSQPQWSGTDASVYGWRFTPQKPHRLWYKFVLKLNGHSTDGFTTYDALATQGDLATNFYGCILQLYREFASPVNRP